MANNENPTTFKYISRYNGETEVALTIDEYVMGGIAVQMWSIEDGYWEPYADVTGFLTNVNDGEAFVDENNLPGIGEWLEENGLAEWTGVMMPSGYCLYPLYRFTQKFYDNAIDMRHED